MLLPTRYLSVGKPYVGQAVVYIPWQSLTQRQHELPPPHDTILLLNDTPKAVEAFAWLSQQGRRVAWAELEGESLENLTPPSPLSASREGGEPSSPSPFTERGLGGEVELPSPAASGEGSGVRANFENLSASRAEAEQKEKAHPTYRLWEPNAFLQESVQHLPPGRALDLGCGSGREAVYLADLGWQVIAVDRLPDALERGRELQARYAPQSPPTHWVCADLEQSGWCPEHPVNLIVNCFYYSSELIRRAIRWLAPEGVLLVEAFTPTHQKAFGRPASPQRVTDLSSLIHLLLPSVLILHASEDWRENGRHTVRLLAQLR